MKTLESRMRAVAAGLPLSARMFVPPELISLLIELCKQADQTNQEKSNAGSNHDEPGRPG